MSPVKDQGNCGSCWAFSTTGAIEAGYTKQTGKMISLSEQQLIDCSRDFGNFGCNGGFMSTSILYVMQNDGITTEQAYPYETRVII